MILAFATSTDDAEGETVVHGLHYPSATLASL